jgi:hypothetical protein
MGTGGFSLGVKRPGREADHSQLPGSENVDLYIHSPIRLHGVVLKIRYLIDLCEDYLLTSVDMKTAVLWIVTTSSLEDG